MVGIELTTQEILAVQVLVPGFSGVDSEIIVYVVIVYVVMKLSCYKTQSRASTANPFHNPPIPQ